MSAPRPDRPETAEAYYARLVAAADDERRLPWVDPDGAASWDIFPYELDSLRVRALQPLLETEPPRRGEDPAQCWCAAGPPAETVWRTDRWALTAMASGLPIFASLHPLAHHDLTDLPPDLAAELGPLTVAIAAAVEALPSVGRAHVNKWGDGGAHLHLCFLGRPARIGQFRGSPVTDWMEHLPPLPADVAAANERAVVADVVRRVGGTALR